MKPENEATRDITWYHAPERVRAARAVAFLDLGNGDLLFAGGWRPGSSLLTGYGWRVPKEWVVQNLLRGSVMPVPFAEDPAEVGRRIEAWERQEAERQRAARWRQPPGSARNGNYGKPNRSGKASARRDGPGGSG